MSDTPDISVLICTRDRADSLRQTLRSLAACDPPPPGLSAEVVVVDNHSGDHTRGVVAEAAAQPGPAVVRYLFAGNGGQAAARNVGLAGSTGRAILFTDDDVRVPAGYLTGMAAPILGANADVVAGGVLLAAHLLRDWMSPMHRSWLASTESTRPADGEVVGANFAFGRHVLDRVPGFDEQLGPGGLGFRDDTLFGYQAKVAGYQLLDNRSAIVVEHHFDPARLTRGSYVSSARKHGHSTAYFVRRYQGYRRRWPTLRWWRHHLRLQRHSLLRRPTPAAVPDEWELQLLVADAFWVRYLAEDRCLPAVAGAGHPARAVEC